MTNGFVGYIYRGMGSEVYIGKHFWYSKDKNRIRWANLSASEVNRMRKVVKEFPQFADKFQDAIDQWELEPLVNKGDEVELRRIRDWVKGRIREKYGLSYLQYKNLWEKYKNGCGICGRVSNGYKRLCIDHNHSTNTVRGLLCGRCNIAIGQFEDNPELLAKAIAYLKENQ